MECIGRYSGRTEYLVQLEWMRQNGYVEQNDEPVRYRSAEEATAAAKARHARFTSKSRIKVNGE